MTPITRAMKIHGIGLFLIAILAACGANDERGISLRTPPPTGIPSTPDAFPKYPEDVSPEEIATLEAEEDRLNALETSASPTGPTLVIPHYEHEFHTVAEAVEVSDTIVVGEVIDEKPGEWREVAGRRERDRFLIVRVEQVLLGDVTGSGLRMREFGQMRHGGVVRDRREGGGALRVSTGERLFLMLVEDPSTGSYVKVNADGVQRLAGGDVEGSERSTTFSRTVEAWTEHQLLDAFETAVEARAGD